MFSSESDKVIARLSFFEADRSSGIVGRLQVFYYKEAEDTKKVVSELFSELTQAVAGNEVLEVRTLNN